ncbi:MAG TPA: O-methyltransferase [Lacipirellulaceae bacterium]|jgi:predicted O-methyltransferase YrrM|nr:O-methyltransferase [Lacipirellulaceae bacterium]
MEQRWIDVDNYYDQLLVKPDAEFADILAASKAGGLPAINVSASQGKLLNLFVQFLGARRVLEVGTLAGYSTAWLAKSLPRDGYLVTLELEQAHAEIARKCLERFSLACKLEIKVGDAVQSLRALHESSATPFDLIFLDADKAQYCEYLEWSVKLSRRGTMIVADNVVRKGEVINTQSEDPLIQGVRKFNAMVAANQRLQGTAIQTVGMKGYDGFCVIYVNG